MLFDLDSDDSDREYDDSGGGDICGVLKNSVNFENLQIVIYLH
jgi:hypothetical protein